MAAYYNEIDPLAAAWLRELIKRGLIAPGDVDERSIEDVRPIDLRGYSQCHFFAGIGGWSLALREAGWPDERPVWTASCPCQPFSSAGKGGGFDDERHLWPAFYWLLRNERPDTVFGEQVASPDGLAWLDLIQADLDAENYTLQALDICAAGFGAPHIRQRLYWCANSKSIDGQISVPWRRPERHCSESIGSGGPLCGTTNSYGEQEHASAERLLHSEPCECGDSVCGNADTRSKRSDRWGIHHEYHQVREWGETPFREHNPSDSQGYRASLPGSGDADRERRPTQFAGDQSPQGPIKAPGLTNGAWANAEWLLCSDGKFRPTQPGLFPLAHGVPARVGRLRGYGNAIVPQVAAEFIKACGGE